MPYQSHANSELSAPPVQVLVHQTEAHCHHHQPQEEVQAAGKQLQLRLVVAALGKLVANADGGQGDEAEVDRVHDAPAAGGGQCGGAQRYVQGEDEEHDGCRHGR